MSNSSNNSHRFLLCLPSYATEFTLIDDDLDNGGGGFSLNKMKITKLYYKRLITNTSENLKVLNIRIVNSGNPNGQDLNTVFFYDGVNIPSSSNKFFANIIADNTANSTISYFNNSIGWDYVNKYGNSDNIKTMQIYIFEDGLTPCADITIDNRLYLEIEIS